MKALVVEPDAVGCLLAGLLLQRMGMPSPEFAESVDTPPRAPYDLVLVAVDPHTNTMASLRCAHPTARLIAVIPERSEALRDACLHAGADAVLTKPLALGALRDALQDIAEDFSAVNWADLRQLFGASGVARLATTLAEDLPIQRRNLDAALRDCNRQELRKIAHTLGGVSAQLGASALSEQWSQAERAVAQGDAVTARRRIPELMRRFSVLVKRVSEEADER